MSGITQADNPARGAAMENARYRFAWDESQLQYREGLAEFDQDTKTDDAHAVTAASNEFRIGYDQYDQSLLDNPRYPATVLVTDP